ncbi:MAG TPA: DNA primase large subunit PriL [Candidatus Thermoplasmatota archaeon]|nr:DNA primase large subunit PriL [Candidatus Thermoplasmatota archaeon]
MDLAGLARYPFLPEAAGHVEREGPSLGELLADKVYASARAKGRERVRLALEDGEIPVPALGAASPPRELLEELLSYVYARLLVSALDDPYVVRRHALAEAVRARELLLRETDGEALTRAAEALDLAFRRDGDAWRAHFTEYLRYAVHLKDVEWKLVAQPLARGHVRMDAKTASRLVQEALRRRIESELPKRLPPEVAKALEADAAPLREALVAKKASLPIAGYGKVELARIPPCMKAILGDLQRGANAAHNARFAIVTFLHKIGMTSEEIMALFAQAPDFREDLTRYQVEHITGVSSGTVYSVPGCDNLQTFNLCAPDDLCRSRTKAGEARVRFPGDYYRYLSEAGAAVDAIERSVPLAKREVLVAAAARQFALLRRLQEIAAHPGFQALDGQVLAGLCQARKAPIEVEVVDGTKRLVVPADDPWRIAHLLSEDWVRTAERAEPTAPASP